MGAFCIDPTGTGIVLAATGTMRDNTLLNVNRVDHRDEESIINCVSTIFGRCFNCTGQVESLCQLESISEVYLSFFVKIEFISHEDYIPRCVGRRVIYEVCQLIF